MHPLLKKQKEEYKHKIQYSRILTNKMTIIAWRLFHEDKYLHLALIIYRLKKDFGFHDWEIANLTGIPTGHIRYYRLKLMPILDSEILKRLADMDFAEEEHAWRALKRHNGKPQGFVIKKKDPWYKNWKEWNEPDFKFGAESQRDYEKKLAKLDGANQEARTVTRPNKPARGGK